jgi:hypothetical protein
VRARGGLERLGGPAKRGGGGVDYIYVRTTIERHIGGFAFEVIALEKSGRWDGVSEPGRTGTGPHANPHSIAAGPGGGREGGRSGLIAGRMMSWRGERKHVGSG